MGALPSEVEPLRSLQMSEAALDAGSFRSRLAARILGLLGVASLAGPAGGCWDGETILDGFGGSGSGGGGGTGGSTTTGSTTTGSTTTQSTTCGTPLRMCFNWSMGDCPTDPAVVTKQLACCSDDGTPCKQTGTTCCLSGWDPCQIDSAPQSAGGECCYQTQAVLCTAGGRPYLVGGRALVAAPRWGAEARGWVEGERPDLDGLTHGERASLAEAWTADGLLEHASVASFSRVSLVLLAAGAPADLVARAHEAALDEVRHARLCFALASAYAGEAIAPGPFPCAGDVHIGKSLAAIAVSTLEEGCIGETVAAVLASEQLDRATDPAVRAALAQIAADEARHAELAWSTLAWAVDAGGREVRVAVEQALRGVLADARSAAPPRCEADPGRRALMEAHGRVDAATAAWVVAAAMAEIVAPAARTLLRRGASRRADDCASTTGTTP